MWATAAAALLALALPVAAAGAPATTTTTTTGAASAKAGAAPVKRRTALISYGTAAEALEPSVREALARLSTVSLKDRASTRADLADAADGGARSCAPESAECHAKLAAFMNVDLVVIATGEHAAHGTDLELSAVDAALAREVARERAPIPGDDARERVRELAELVVEPHLHYGALTVASPVPRATLSVDGTVHATPPYPRVTLRLRAGPHEVVVARPGYATFSADVVVKAGTETSLDAPLVPAGAASPLTGPLVIGASGAVTALVAGAVALAIDIGLQNGLGSFEEKQAYKATGIVAAVVAGGGAVVAVVGGVGALLALDEGAPATATAAPP